MSELLKSLLSSKTVWLGILQAAIGVGEYLADMPKGASIPFMVSGVATVLIRTFTTQPLKGTWGWKLALKTKAKLEAKGIAGQSFIAAKKAGH